MFKIIPAISDPGNADLPILIISIGKKKEATRETKTSIPIIRVIYQKNKF